MSTISRPVRYAFADGCTGSVTLAYDSAEPLLVTADFGFCKRRLDRIVWTIARDVLAEGLIGLAGLADVCCWNSDEVYHIAFTSHEGAVTVQLDADEVRALLIDAEDLVPYGAEVVDFGAELTSLLIGGAR